MSSSREIFNDGNNFSLGWGSGNFTVCAPHYRYYTPTLVKMILEAENVQILSHENIYNITVGHMGILGDLKGWSKASLP